MGNMMSGASVYGSDEDLNIDVAENNSQPTIKIFEPGQRMDGDCGSSY